MPLVSVVIPTHLRPRLVARAVRSAFAQTLRDIEVIVVVDGCDGATLRVLHRLAEPRLRIVLPRRRLGNADARNLGVRHARARWIAFLDDDDEWLPGKLEKQMREASGAAQRYPIIACRMLARSEASEFLWPRRAPHRDEPLSEYFFCRRSPFTGEGMVINSAILAPRELLLDVPFQSGLERHVDPDWLLRAARLPDVGLRLVPDPEPLLVWNIERGRQRITNVRDWRYSLEYARRSRELMTPRAYAAFLLHVVSSAAAAQPSRRAFFVLLAEALARGRPSVVDVLSHAANFLVPFSTQRALARAYGRLWGAARSGRASVVTTEAPAG